MTTPLLHDNMSTGSYVHSLAVLFVMCLLVACFLTARQDTHQRCFIHKFIHSVCLLPWHSSLSAHNFQGAFSRAIKLGRPLPKVVFYCSVVFWKKRTEQKATNIPKHEKTKQLSVRYFQQRLKTHFYK